MTRTFTLTACLAGLLLANAAQGQLLLYSGLEGVETGSIHDVNDGYGWNTGSPGWNTQNPDSPYMVANDSPLSYMNLATSAEGNYISGGNGYTNLGRRIDNGPNGVFDSLGYIESPWSSGDYEHGVLWFSALMQPINSISSNQIRFVGDTNTRWSPDQTGDVAIKNDGTNWGLNIKGGDFTSANKAVTSSAADLLVARFNMDGTSSTVHLWVNPTELGGDDPALETADASLSDLDATVIAVRNIGLYLGSGMGQGRADEIRMGVTYADVTPTAGELLAGDANGDGQVDGNDLISVEENFGGTGDPGIPGDANGDGQVDGNDLISVEENFGATSGGSSVPEPATIALLGLCGTVLLRKRR